MNEKQPMLRKLLLTLTSALFILSSLSTISTSSSEDSFSLRVEVREAGTGRPLPNAAVLVLLGSWGWYSRKVFEGRTDFNGTLCVELQAGRNYMICVFYDDPLTLGLDYVPSMKGVKATQGEELCLKFELFEGTSVLPEGEILFVETTKSFMPSFYVLNPESMEIMEFDGYKLQFGKAFEFPNKHIGLSPNLIIVPAETPFIIKVIAEVELTKEAQKAWYYGKERAILSFIVDTQGISLPKKGEVLHIDLTRFSLLNALSTLKEVALKLDSMIKNREQEGFYLAIERQKLTRINSLVIEAEGLLDQGAYEACFAKLREAYTEGSNLKEWLDGMHVEAKRSTFLLIPFLAFTAVCASFLCFEEKRLKLLASTTLFSLLLLLTYYLHPGSKIVSPRSFLGASLTSLILILALFSFIPSFLKAPEFMGRVPLRNLIVPIFSIAKRNLRRRKLRSALTLTSVVVLVSSFITLTSFSTGYGLILSKLSERGRPNLSMMVRTLKSPVFEAYAPFSGGKGVFWFSPLEESLISWFESREHVSLVAPKFENEPRRQYFYMGAYNPLGYLEGHPIFGMIGIIPSAEARLLSLNKAVVEGRYLRDDDENCVLISEKLKQELNLRVGEEVRFQISGRSLKLRVVGILDDKTFEEIRDLDGYSFLPMKVIELRRTPVEEGLEIVTEGLVPCSASETIVTTWKLASRLPELKLSRIGLLLKRGNDPLELARIIALNKGLRVWAATQEGTYFVRLSTYFEGKGLPIAVPWLMVVLNVVVTVLNSLHERRREILIYSSIGINPSQIASIFLVEAGIIGIVGGGAGYILGLGWYRILSIIGLGLQVKQKVSALWTLAAMAFSLAAVLIGGMTALRGSIVLTPSLRRRWKIDSRRYKIAEPFRITLPISISEEEVESFISFFLKELRLHLEDREDHTYLIGEKRGEEGPQSRVLEFYYSSGGQTSQIHTRNKLILRKEGRKKEYEALLLSDGLPDAVQRTASFVRRIVLKWNVRRGKLRGGLDEGK